MITVIKNEPLGKGRYRIGFDTGVQCIFYRGDIVGIELSEGADITEDVYNHLLKDVLGKRAKKRAMFLLEKMDRTEKQLRDQLQKNEYPQVCVDDAICYVKKYHYLDDFRYAQNYVRYLQEKMSRGQITIKLIQKGISKEFIQMAIDEVYESDEYEQIRAILEKKHFENSDSNSKEFQRMYQFLMRRGFKSSDVLRAMKYISDTTYC